MNNRARGGGLQAASTPWPVVWRRAPVSTLFSTWFGVGFLPRVPGTWGSLAAVPLADAVYRVAGLYGLFVLVLAASAGGVVASGRTARARGVTDPGPIVIDEVAGQSIALTAVYAFCPMNHTSPVFWGMVLLAFVLFRLLDIWKPGPIRRLERLPGGWGVMCDDLLAGAVVAFLIAALLVVLYRR